MPDAAIETQFLDSAKQPLSQETLNEQRSANNLGDEPMLRLGPSWKALAHLFPSGPVWTEAGGRAHLDLPYAVVVAVLRPALYVRTCAYGAVAREAHWLKPKALEDIFNAVLALLEAGPAPRRPLSEVAPTLAAFWDALEGKRGALATDDEKRSAFVIQPVGSFPFPPVGPTLAPSRMGVEGPTPTALESRTSTNRGPRCSSWLS